MRILPALILAFLPLSVYAKPIKVTTVSGIDFGVGTAGDLGKTVPPGTTENSTNGSCNVTGDANRAYTIVLPAVPITMKTGNGPTADTISVSAFQSFPAEGANGLLNALGAQTLFVGATRAALKINQRAGSYTGAYSITVVY